MSKGTSHNVWAEKFKLKELTSQSAGSYNQEGSKVSCGAMMINRAYAVARNAELNNEVYVFDEEKTDELLLIREENIKKRADEAESKANEANKKAVSGEDIIALVKALANPEPTTREPTPANIDKDLSPTDDNLDDLKEIIKEEDLGIRVGAKDTREKVEAKITEERAKK